MQKMILLRIITIYRVTLATIYRVTLATEPHAVLKVLTTNKTHTFLDPNYSLDPSISSPFSQSFFLSCETDMSHSIPSYLSSPTSDLRISRIISSMTFGCLIEALLIGPSKSQVAQYLMACSLINGQFLLTQQN